LETSIAEPLGNVCEEILFEAGIQRWHSRVMYAEFVSKYTFGKYAKLWELEWSASTAPTKKSEGFYRKKASGILLISSSSCTKINRFWWNGTAFQ